MLWKREEWTALICALVRLYAHAYKEGSSVYLKNLGRGYRSLETAVISVLQAGGWTINAILRGCFPSSLLSWH